MSLLESILNRKKYFNTDLEGIFLCEITSYEHKNCAEVPNENVEKIT